MLSYIIYRLKKLINFLRPRYRLNEVEDIPESPQKGIVYVIGAMPNPWALAFPCPCGCEALIQLNLLQEASPQWSFTKSRSGKITIWPSIWRKVGCKSHFFIQKGRIIWC